MTPGERRQPKVLNGSRRLRIARGAGTTVTEVNSLVNRFEQAAKMMKTVAKGGVPQMPGMPAMPGGGGGSSAGKNKAKAKGKGGSKSGNPAKRAAEAAGTTYQAPGTIEKPASGSAFGLGR
jgi:signal recognition particle subunit SRP54